MSVHRLTLGDVLGEHRRGRPQGTAVVDGEVRLTYPELDDRVNRLAGALAADGVGTGGRVLWLGQNSFRVLELLLACGRLGAIFCPANWRQSADELAYVLDDLTPAVVVWEESEAVEKARGQVSLDARWVRPLRPRRPRSTRSRPCSRSTRPRSTGVPTRRC
jgi:acyl-CoA synthetase (AMP-forming)/AMP-acid ligase II